MDTLFKLSYIVFVVSFSFLLLSYLFYTPSFFSTKQLLSEDISDFSFSGQVTDISQGSGIVFVEMSSSCSINAMFFVKEHTNYSYLQGNYITGFGHIDEYKGKKQYIFDEIRIK